MNPFLAVEERGEGARDDGASDAAPPSPAAVTYAGEGDGKSPVSLSAEYVEAGEDAEDAEDAHGRRHVAKTKTKEPSAEERMNETAVAVIRATTSSGQATSSGEFGAHDDALFSERLAAATAKIATLGAQLKEKTAAARQGKMERKPIGGKELLRRLQESAASQDVRKVGGLVTVQSLRHAMPADAAPTETKVNKTLGYKISAAARRTSQKLLQNVGAAEKAQDTDFDNLWTAIRKQEQLLEEICKTGAEYKHAQRTVFERGNKLALLIRALVESGDKNNTWEGAPAVARTAAMKEAMKMCDISEALAQRCTPLTEEVFDWNILEPASLRSRELPAYKACVAKRLDYMRDMDAFERQLASMRKRPANAKNADELSLKEEQTRRAKQRFQDFSTKLVDELAIVDGMRYEMAYSLVRGFANVQCFNLERQLDVARVLRGQ